MDAALFQRFHPEEYYRRFLEGGVRPDGRGPRDRRKARLKRAAFSSADGSASLRLGDCSVVVGVTALVTEVLPEFPARGHVEVNVNLPPMCSAIFREKGKAIARATFLTNALNDILNNANVLDPSQLSIHEGELYWVLKLEIVCLNFDGNLVDACLLAAVAALEDTRLPALAKSSIGSGDDVTSRMVVVAAGSPGVVFPEAQVALSSRPFSVTFARLPGNVWAVDPSGDEEGLGCAVSLCLVGDRWLVYHQGGGNVSTEQFLAELMPVARSMVPELLKLLEGAAVSEGISSDIMIDVG